MYVLEVRKDGELYYKITTLELQDVATEVFDWFGSPDSRTEIRIFLGTQNDFRGVE